MAEDIFSAIPFIGGGGGASINWGLVGIWTFLIISIVAILWILVFVAIINKKTIKVIEIDFISHRIKQYRGRIKKHDTNQSQVLYLGKYKKNIPMPQQEDMFYKGKADAIILIKDNNGLHHTFRILQKEDLIAYFKTKGIDITLEYNEKTFTDPKTQKVFKVKTENPYYKYYAFYSMPNPHEDLDFLGDQCEEANREYKQNTPWWASPTVMVIATAFICMIMFIMTIILARK